jgi:hypothetical protein
MNTSAGTTKNWGFATTNLAASDFGIYQSTSNGGDAISAGTARLYFNGTGAATFSSNVVTSTYFNVNNSTRDFYINASADLGFGPLPTVQVASAHTLQFATNNTLRASILQDGQFLMNTAVALSAGWLCISVPSNNYNAIVLRDSGTTYSSTNYYQIFTNSSNGISGGITHPTASTVGFYTGPSDQRLKSNIKDVEESVLPLFNNAKLKTYNHIADEDESVVYKGFLAQDMVDNFPEAYGKDKEGYYMYNPIGYIPYLVKAIQELSAQNQELKSRLDKAGL